MKRKRLLEGLRDHRSSRGQYRHQVSDDDELLHGEGGADDEEEEEEDVMYQREESVEKRLQLLRTPEEKAPQLEEPCLSQPVMGRSSTPRTRRKVAELSSSNKKQTLGSAVLQRIICVAEEAASQAVSMPPLTAETHVSETEVPLLNVKDELAQVEVATQVVLVNKPPLVEDAWSQELKEHTLERFFPPRKTAEVIRPRRSTIVFPQDEEGYFADKLVSRSRSSSATSSVDTRQRQKSRLGRFPVTRRSVRASEVTLRPVGMFYCALFHTRLVAKSPLCALS